MQPSERSNTTTFSENELRQTDVLLGRGNKCDRHGGTVAFKALAVANLSAYMNAESSSDKTYLTVEIVNHVLKEGGRFLRETKKSSGQWVEVDKNKARETVRQVLWSAAKNAKKRRQRPPTAGAIVLAMQKRSTNKQLKQQQGLVLGASTKRTKKSPPTLVPCRRNPQLWIAPAPTLLPRVAPAFDRCRPMIIEVPPPRPTITPSNTMVPTRVSSPPAVQVPPIPRPTMVPSATMIAAAPTTVLPPVQPPVKVPPNTARTKGLPNALPRRPTTSTTMVAAPAPRTIILLPTVQQPAPLLPRPPVVTAQTKVSPPPREVPLLPKTRIPPATIVAASARTQVSPPVEDHLPTMVAPTTKVLPPVQRQVKFPPNTARTKGLPTPLPTTVPSTTMVAAPRTIVLLPTVQQPAPLPPRPSTIITPAPTMMPTKFVAPVQHQAKVPPRPTPPSATAAAPSTKVSLQVKQKQQQHHVVEKGQCRHAEDIRPTDILLGRSKRSHYHLGTIAFKILISVNLAAYRDTDTHYSEKISMSVELANCIYNEGGRFLQESKQQNGGVWLEIDREKTREKVQQGFSNAQKRPDSLVGKIKFVCSNKFHAEDSFRDILDILSRDAAVLQFLCTATKPCPRGARKSTPNKVVRALKRPPGAATA